MILSNLQTPQKSLYLVGANILTLVKEYQFEAIAPLLLFSQYNSTYQNISFSYFSLGLDWLHLTETVELTNTGDISPCS